MSLETGILTDVLLLKPLAIMDDPGEGVGKCLICSGCYNKNTINWMADKQQKFLLTALEAGKSKIKALGDSVSGEDTLSDSQSSSRCVLIW